MFTNVSTHTQMPPLHHYWHISYAIMVGKKKTAYRCEENPLTYKFTCIQISWHNQKSKTTYTVSSLTPLISIKITKHNSSAMKRGHNVLKLHRGATFMCCDQQYQAADLEKPLTCQSLWCAANAGGVLEVQIKR